MHELALTESIVELVRERLGDQRVVLVRLEVGRLTAVVPEALKFCFEICSRGTSLEGARLEIDEVPARASCRRCGSELELTDGIALCSCGSAELSIATGNELRIKHVEVT